jgi:hypothetical protein
MIFLMNLIQDSNGVIVYSQSVIKEVAAHVGHSVQQGSYQIDSVFFLKVEFELISRNKTY